MKIFPRENLYGEYAVPPDKSITHRAIMLGALAKGKTTIVNPFTCQDTQTLISCVKKLGAKVNVRKDYIEIRGAKKLLPAQKLDCGNSIVALRFLCGVVAGRGGRAVLTGGRQLCRKSMREIKEPLEKAGATVALTNYVTAPVLVESETVRAIDYTVPRGNSQVKSSLFFCAIAGGVKASVREEYVSRNHTEILLKELGANVAFKDGGTRVELNGGELIGKKIAVGRDFTLAANYLALGLTLGRVTCHNVNLNPTRTVLLNVLERMGAKIVVNEKEPVCGERVADITAYKSKLKATHVGEDEACRIVDELPILAFLMGLADGESIISAGYAGKSEIGGGDADGGVDFLTATADAINAVGGMCRVFDGGLVVTGVGKYNGGNIQTRGYSLLAMSGAIALITSENGGDIDEEVCDGDDHKAFFQELDKNAFAIVRPKECREGVDAVYAKALNMTGLFTLSCTSLYPKEENLKRIMPEVKNYDGYCAIEPYVNDVTRRIYKLRGKAKKIKSANLCVDGLGYSTDGDAFSAMMKYIGESLAGKRVLILGCGGFGRSIAFAASTARAKVDIYDRLPKRALEFKRRTKENVCVLNELSSDVKYDYVVDTVYGGADDFSGGIALMKCGAVVDLSSAKSRFIEQAENAGKKIIGRDCFEFLRAYYTACAFSGKDVNDQKAFSMYEIYKAEAKNERLPS